TRRLAAALVAAPLALTLLVPAPSRAADDPAVQTVRDLYAAFSVRTLGAGCLLAGLMIVPILNLLTPLFGIALMVHLHKRLSRRLLVAGPGR
ncbi:hypothetical protein OMR07_10480, partial [Methylobacterium organophilum]|nr:hypothetical protein [Methylobacterium organophilum]